MAGPTDRHRKGQTILRRMLALLLAVLVIQMLIYLLVFFCGGTIEQTERNAFYILREQTANRKLDLENDMLQRWSNVDEGKSDVMGVVARVLEENHATPDALAQNQELAQQVLAASAEKIVDMLRRNGVTGAFLVLDGAGDTYPGFYIRDYDPASFTADNADLLLERGLPELSRSLGIPMDSYWSALVRFPETGASSNFFFHPLNAAKSAAHEDRRGDYFNHWTGRFSLSPADRPVIAFSVPLVCEDGTVIGVLGVDLTIDYLAEQLKYDELGEENSGAYFLGVSFDGGNTYERVCTSGPNFEAYFGQRSEIKVLPDANAGIVTVPESNYPEQTVYGALQPIRLYNNNTPFEGERWALIGMLNGEHLLRFSREIKAMILVSTAVSLLLGMVLILFAAHSFTQPITNLMSDLRLSNPEKPIRLRRTRIVEIDRLSESIEDLSNAAAESASRISKIVSMSHIPVGVFEYRNESARVFCSKGIYTVLGWPETVEEDAYLPCAEFKRRIAETTKGRDLQHGEELVFRIPRPGFRDRWVQLFYRTEGETVLGAFL
ncbi:MAG: hypothetical protein RRY53_02710, partial [Pseudoflavonifractor sp.]